MSNTYSQSLDFDIILAEFEKNKKSARYVHDLKRINDDVLNFYSDLLVSSSMDDMSDWDDKSDDEILSLIVQGRVLLKAVESFANDITILKSEKDLLVCMDTGRIKRRRIL